MFITVDRMLQERELVQLLADPTRRLDAMRALVDGVTATELKSTKLTETALRALVEGLADPNPRIRWWCVQLLDHVPDVRAVSAVINLLDDPCRVSAATRPTPSAASHASPSGRGVFH